MRVPIEKVPIEVRRRAARALAALTGDHVFPRADRGMPQPAFGAEAAAFHRPDLDDVAYWEIELEGLRTALPLPGGEAKEYDRGFIVIATGGHDVPVPHFSLELAPPSRQLEAIGGDAARFVKLDALCYAAEDAAGTLLAHIGTMPPKLAPPAELPKRLPQGWATLEPAASDSEDGDAAKEGAFTRSREPRPLKKYGAWRSWEECRRGYAESYRLQLAALAERASGPWGAEKLVAEFGEGIHSGDTHTVLLLEEGRFELSGPGADLVSAELNPQPLPPALRLTVKAGRDVKDTSFDVHLFYGSGEETLSFFIVPEDAPSSTMPSVSTLGPVPEFARGGAR